MEKNIKVIKKNCKTPICIDTEGAQIRTKIKKTKDYNVISMGHRNPQGLIIKGETILSTEHGPFGGDELNTVIEGRNYGWPTSAYGFTYGLENIYELDHADEYE